MTKFEIAGYLVNLHTLLEAQSKGVVSIPSTVLADEYNKHWDLLKATITKENDNESKVNRNDSYLDEGRANPSRDQSGRRERDWEYGGPKPNSTR